MVLYLSGLRVADNVIMHFPDDAGSPKGAKSDMGTLFVIDLSDNYSLICKDFQARVCGFILLSVLFPSSGLWLFISHYFRHFYHVSVVFLEIMMFLFLQIHKLSFIYPKSVMWSHFISAFV